jgi:hypothetical protein
MKRPSIVPSILLVALALGTAWAVRGKFGHEQGAAWAGAIGALSLILGARRDDWNRKAFRITMAAAVGWGISGVMSYGAIVGYGKGSDFVNVFYGLLMLFVLGILYGFIGGGFFGLALIDSRTIRVKWASLLTQMVAMGLLTYGVLINQLGWLMTPPRSEMWAACLGAALALGWYVMRNGHAAVMRVALWSAIGAGFGFAFGNFLQVMGISTGMPFNFWNVMEYSIGFFGGAGMAYGTLTSALPVSDGSPSREWIALAFVSLFVPFVVWQQSFVTERFDFIVDGGGPASIAVFMKSTSIAGILLVTAVAIRKNYLSGIKLVNRAESLKVFFVLYTALYILLSFLVTGLFVHPLEQYLYIINLVAVLFLLSRGPLVFDVPVERSRMWLAVLTVSVLIIALLAFVAIHSHGELPGSKGRFGVGG